MDVLRIILTQNKANYKKEEVDKNKLTYPLPPFSTVIGALHNACGFSEYKKMDLSIQGNYKSLSKQTYTDHCFLDSTQDDRGILVKLSEGGFQSRAYVKVAQVKKGQGNSFRKGITIDVFDKKLLEEYRNLKELNDELDRFKKNRIDSVIFLIQKLKKRIQEKKKKSDIKPEVSRLLHEREKQLENRKKMIEEKFNDFKLNKYTKEIDKYKSLTTSLKYYEILNEIKLIIHVNSDKEILESIKENIYNLKAIGRSEDFVDVIECEYVGVSNKIEEEIVSEYSAYLNYDLVRQRDILLNRREENIPTSGTKYWINKVYDRSEGPRKFEKVKVIYGSKFYIDEDSEGVYFDGKYIINFN